MSREGSSSERFGLVSRRGGTRKEPLRGACVYQQDPQKLSAKPELTLTAFTRYFVGDCRFSQGLGRVLSSA